MQSTNILEIIIFMRLSGRHGINETMYRRTDVNFYGKASWTEQTVTLKNYTSKHNSNESVTRSTDHGPNKEENFGTLINYQYNTEVARNSDLNSGKLIILFLNVQVLSDLHLEPVKYERTRILFRIVIKVGQDLGKLLSLIHI